MQSSDEEAQTWMRAQTRSPEDITDVLELLDRPMKKYPPDAERVTRRPYSMRNREKFHREKMSAERPPDAERAAGNPIESSRHREKMSAEWPPDAERATSNPMESRRHRERMSAEWPPDAERATGNSMESRRRQEKMYAPIPERLHPGISWRVPSKGVSRQMISSPTYEELNNNLCQRVRSSISDLTSQLHEFSKMNSQLMHENARLSAEIQLLRSQLTIALSGPTQPDSVPTEPGQPNNIRTWATGPIPGRRR
jgi:hypothetical protein